MRPRTGGGEDTLGRCRECRGAVTPGCVLIEYESGGERAVFAECPDCRAVVKLEGVGVSGAGHSPR